MKTKSLTGLALVLGILAAAPAVVSAQETTVKESAAAKVEVPAPGTVAMVVKDGQNFSILSKAITAAGLEETLGGKGPYTLFAPTDAAFTKLPAEALSKLMLPENKEKLRALLMYHVVAGEQPAATLVDGKIKTAGGESIEIDVDGNNEPVEVNDAKVVNADQRAANGTIHVIDKVLIPDSLDGFEGLDN